MIEDFKIRMYTKKELALMYFPESYPRTAVNHLMVWIRRCTPLWEELQMMGYSKTSKSFSPGASLSGNMCHSVWSFSPISASHILSSGFSSVAEGMAIALCPAESIAQQSLQPSVMKSLSPGFSIFTTGRL